MAAGGTCTTGWDHSAFQT
ncbi:hypothetical protein D030_0941A, partial [Vibrio parahaemolyticus AQ3810]